MKGKISKNKIDSVETRGSGHGDGAGPSWKGDDRAAMVTSTRESDEGSIPEMVGYRTDGEKASQSFRTKVEEMLEEKRGLTENFIKRRPIDEVIKAATPKALLRDKKELQNGLENDPKTGKNCLETAIMVSYWLHKRAEDMQKDYEKEKFVELAKSVENFAAALLDPLMTNASDMEEFKESADLLAKLAMDKRIEKLMSHNVILEVLLHKWFRCGFFNWPAIINNYSIVLLTCLWLPLEFLLLPLILIFFLIRELVVKGDFTEEGPFWNYFGPNCYSLPLHVFLRDILSYFTLLGLHFVVCLSPATSFITWVEWVIFVFFFARFVMELKQFFGKHRKIKRYFSDHWNYFDVFTMSVYVVLVLLRLTGCSIAAGYCYGVNTIFLTFRTLGHVMETNKAAGTQQVALFQIIGDMMTVFFQFFTAILAFSFALAKVYIMERSYHVEDERNGTEEEIYCRDGEITCWWKVVQHLLWSLLGIVDVEPLNSRHVTSESLAYALYAVFLIIGVIVLVNMMIALLSNTYQRVKDDSYCRLTKKKAITVHTYREYHAVPVPLNIISMIALLLYRWCSRPCCQAGGENRPSSSKELDKQNKLNTIVSKLGKTYLSTHGNSFPVTSDTTKIDRLLKEMEKTRQMMHHFHTEDCGEDINKDEAWHTEEVTIICQDDGRHTLQLPPSCSQDVLCHSARYKVPFSRQHPKFEVVIEKSDPSKALAVGVVLKDYNANLFPGWDEDSVGYQINTGTIFCIDIPKYQITDEGAQAFKNDVVGIEVQTFADYDGKACVTFTLNQRRVYETLTLSTEGQQMYPYVAMTYSGACVKTKMYNADELKKRNRNGSESVENTSLYGDLGDTEGSITPSRNGDSIPFLWSPGQ